MLKMIPVYSRKPVECDVYIVFRKTNVTKLYKYVLFCSVPKVMSDYTGSPSNIYNRVVLTLISSTIIKHHRHLVHSPVCRCCVDRFR